VNHISIPISGGFVNFGNIELSGEAGKYFSVFQWVRFGPDAPASRATASKFNFGTGQRSWAITSPSGQFKILASADGGTVNMKQYQTYKYFNDGAWHPIGYIWENGTLRFCADLDYDLAMNKLADPAFTHLHQGSANVSLGSLTSGGSFPNGWVGGLGPAVTSTKPVTEADWLNFVYDGLSPNDLSLECLMKTPGGNVLDTSGNGYDGVLAGTAVWKANGPFGERSTASTRALVT